MKQTPGHLLRIIPDNQSLAKKKGIVMNLDQQLSTINDLIAAEREAGHVNSLEDLSTHRQRQQRIRQLWEEVQTELKPIENAIEDLPNLPPLQVISWAQTLLAMPNLVFLELDTTGLSYEDELVRFTLLDRRGQFIEDFFIRPTKNTLSSDASYVNGIKAADLADAAPLPSVWERIRHRLHGAYVLSYNQIWDLGQLHLAAKTAELPALVVIGECLQQQARLYCGEYGLSLSEVCDRIGHPLPAHPHQTSRDRALGQYHIVVAMSQAKGCLFSPTLRRTDNPAAFQEEDEKLGEHPF